MTQRVKVFPYVIVEERPLSDLVNFADHRRLQTFYHKGCVCVSCGLEGTRLIKGRNVKDGSIHWDVYSDDLLPLTVDHILPKSLGGEDVLDNYQPMCSPCNSRKGNGLKNRRVGKDGSIHPKPKGLVRVKPDMDIVGMELWRVYKGCQRNKKPSFLGIVNSIGINPHCGVPAAVVIDKKTSYFNLKRNIYVRVAGSSPGTPDRCPEGATIRG